MNGSHLAIDGYLKPQQQLSQSECKKLFHQMAQVLKHQSKDTTILCLSTGKSHTACLCIIPFGHFSLHFIHQENAFSLDIFSFDDLDTAQLIEVVRQQLQLRVVNFNVINRAYPPDTTTLYGTKILHSTDTRKAAN